MLRGILTDKQGNVDELVIFGFIGIFAYVAYSGYDLLWLHNAFSPASWSGGFASIIAAVGGAIGARNMMNGRDQDVRAQSDQH
jgi:hypothetical protein